MILLIDQILHLERQLEEIQLGKTRLHQYEKKKKKRKVSQQQQHHYYQHHDGPVLSPTMESVPVKSSYHMPQAAACRGSVVEVQCWHLLCVTKFAKQSRNSNTVYCKLFKVENFADGQGTSNSLENFCSSFALVKCAHVCRLCDFINRTHLLNNSK